METMDYLLKVNVVFVLLYGAYHLLLRKSTLFAANRTWLLLAPVVAYAVPLVRLPASVPLAGATELLPFATGATALQGGATGAAGLPLGQVVLMIHVAGVLLSLVVLAVRYARAWRVSRGQHGEALSFFGRIVLPADLDGDEERSLVAHERVHARQGHSFDVLYFELLAAASWWNPLWRSALRELRMVHELQADAVASAFHPDYARLLLSRALGVPVSSLVNSFRSSNLKTRIAMLNMKSSRSTGLKYALSIPLVALAFVAVSPRVALSLPAEQQPPVYDLGTVQVQPEFPGGMEAMYAFLKETVHYPDSALKEKVQGKVYVEFIVGADGKVRDVGLRRGVREDLNKEALRAVSSMPDWSPGKMDGKVVATRFTIPIAFTLQEKETPEK